MTYSKTTFVTVNHNSLVFLPSNVSHSKTTFVTVNQLPK